MTYWQTANGEVQNSMEELFGFGSGKEQKYSHYDTHENSFKKAQEMSLGVSDHTSSGIC